MKGQQSMVSKVQKYLAVRRKLGYQLEAPGKELMLFARYADKIGYKGPITTEFAVQWAKLPKSADPSYWARRLDILRCFAKHRLLFDPDTEIPPPGLLGPSIRRKPPYIYSDEQVKTLLKAAAQLSPMGGFQPRTYVTLFGLLACTGLRISEALRLTQDDVDLKSGVLSIKTTKFNKSRLVPVHHSTQQALRDYSEFRHSYHTDTMAREFFLSERATPLNYRQVLYTFIKLRRKLEWDKSKRRPRIHDLRHTFAVRRLLTWYEQGANVDERILALSTYLGHAQVTDTYWYLTAVPELLAVVSKRFENFAVLEGESIS